MPGSGKNEIILATDFIPIKHKQPNILKKIFLQTFTIKDDGNQKIETCYFSTVVLKS